MLYVIAEDRTISNNSHVKVRESPPSGGEELRGAILMWYVGGNRDYSHGIRTTDGKLRGVRFNQLAQGVPLSDRAAWDNVFEGKSYDSLSTLWNGCVVQSLERRHYFGVPNHSAGVLKPHNVIVSKEYPAYLLKVFAEVANFPKALDLAKRFKLPLADLEKKLAV